MAVMTSQWQARFACCCGVVEYCGEQQAKTAIIPTLGDEEAFISLVIAREVSSSTGLPLEICSS